MDVSLPNGLFVGDIDERTFEQEYTKLLEKDETALVNVLSVDLSWFLISTNFLSGILVRRQTKAGCRGHYQPVELFYEPCRYRFVALYSQKKMQLHGQTGAMACDVLVCRSVWSSICTDFESRRMSRGHRQHTHDHQRQHQHRQYAPPAHQISPPPLPPPPTMSHQPALHPTFPINLQPTSQFARMATATELYPAVTHCPSLAGPFIYATPTPFYISTCVALPRGGNGGVSNAYTVANTAPLDPGHVCANDVSTGGVFEDGDGYVGEVDFSNIAAPPATHPAEEGDLVLDCSADHASQSAVNHPNSFPDSVSTEGDEPEEVQHQETSAVGNAGEFGHNTTYSHHHHHHPDETAANQPDVIVATTETSPANVTSETSSCVGSSCTDDISENLCVSVSAVGSNDDDATNVISKDANDVGHGEVDREATATEVMADVKDENKDGDTETRLLWQAVKPRKMPPQRVPPLATTPPQRRAVRERVIPSTSKGVSPVKIATTSSLAVKVDVPSKSMAPSTHRVGDKTKLNEVQDCETSKAADDGCANGEISEAAMIAQLLSPKKTKTKRRQPPTSQMATRSPTVSVEPSMVVDVVGIDVTRRYRSEVTMEEASRLLAATRDMISQRQRMFWFHVATGPLVTDNTQLCPMQNQAVLVPVRTVDGLTAAAVWTTSRWSFRRQTVNALAYADLVALCYQQEKELFSHSKDPSLETQQVQARYGQMATALMLSDRWQDGDDLWINFMWFDELRDRVLDFQQALRDPAYRRQQRAPFVVLAELYDEMRRRAEDVKHRQRAEQVAADHRWICQQNEDNPLQCVATRHTGKCKVEYVFTPSAGGEPRVLTEWKVLQRIASTANYGPDSAQPVWFPSVAQLKQLYTHPEAIDHHALKTLIPQSPLATPIAEVWPDQSVSDARWPLQWQPHYAYSNNETWTRQCRDEKDPLLRWYNHLSGSFLAPSAPELLRNELLSETAFCVWMTVTNPPPECVSTTLHWSGKKMPQKANTHGVMVGFVFGEQTDDVVNTRLPVGLVMAHHISQRLDVVWFRDLDNAHPLVRIINALCLYHPQVGSLSASPGGWCITFDERTCMVDGDDGMAELSSASPFPPPLTWWPWQELGVSPTLLRGEHSRAGSKKHLPRGLAQCRCIFMSLHKTVHCIDHAM